MRKLFYVFLASFGFSFWLISFVFGIFTVFFASLGDKLFPITSRGNCWAFAIPKWQKYGGYLAIRASDDNRVLWKIPVPHVLWVKDLPENTELEQYLPVERQQRSAVPWHVLWYKGEIVTEEAPHPAKE